MKCDPSIALSATALYRSPSGRLCRWMPLGGDQRQVTSHAFFEYVDADQQHRGPRRLWADGFVLAPANYHLLREAHDATAG